MVAEEHSSCSSFMRSVWSKQKNTSSNNAPINKSCILCLGQLRANLFLKTIYGEVGFLNNSPVIQLNLKNLTYIYVKQNKGYLQVSKYFSSRASRCTNKKNKSKLVSISSIPVRQFLQHTHTHPSAHVNDNQHESRKLQQKKRREEKAACGTCKVEVVAVAKAVDCSPLLQLQGGKHH